MNIFDTEERNGHCSLNETMMQVAESFEILDAPEHILDAPGHTQNQRQDIDIVDDEEQTCCKFMIFI